MHKNGQKISECYYVDNKLEGKGTEWSESGQIKLEMNFKDGLENGLQTGYDPLGQIQSEIEFKEGIPNGKYIFYKDGEIIDEGMNDFKKGDSPYNLDNLSVN